MKQAGGTDDMYKARKYDPLSESRVLLPKNWKCSSDALTEVEW